MDPSRYKTVKAKRGFVYNYYSSPSQQDKPVLLFLHGYPSTSSEWTTYVAFFEKRGYGAIVPDLLGFGKTDKPTDTKFYVGSGVVNDDVDILDVEHVDKVVIIGHDWYDPLLISKTIADKIVQGCEGGIEVRHLSARTRSRIRVRVHTLRAPQDT